MEQSEFQITLLEAIAGSHNAVEKILDMYMPLIDKYSVIEGAFDEDCKQYIVIRIALQISKFQI